MPDTHSLHTMILSETSIQSLAKSLAPHMGEPVWPGLTDPVVIARAREFARQSGLWDKIDVELHPHVDIPVLKRSAFRDYKRTGSRKAGEDAVYARVNETRLAALALWIEHPKADADYLQDLIWAWCETTWWVFAAHENIHVDLFSSARACELAEYSHIFSGQLEPEVRARISREVATRVLDIAHDYRCSDWWQTGDNNWNTVCNSNLIQTALYEIKDPDQLAAFIHPLCRRMDYAINYFTDDGGCVEGVEYWAYGFSNFVDAAIALYQRTGRKINLMAEDKIQRICRFPMAAFLRAPVRASFADGGNGYLNMGHALRINFLTDVPELFQLVETNANGLPEISDIRALALYRGELPLRHTDRTDCLLPLLGLAKANAAEADVVLAAQAGTNDVSHNHNDIGSFLLVKTGVAVLTDPGTPVYSAKTFGPKRYELLMCRSRGHSVPIVNGYEQQEGSAFFGSLAAEGLNGPGGKTITIDMSRAYPDPTLLKLTRVLELGRDGTLRIVDRFEFSSKPLELEEALVTFEPAQVRDGCVEVGHGVSATTIRADVAGEFQVETFSPEQHEGLDPRPLHRVRFLPSSLAVEMCLSFLIE